MRISAAIILASALIPVSVSFLTACGSSSSADEGMVDGVVVHTSVTPGGEFPDYLDVKLKDVPRKKLDAKYFKMTGRATNWMDPSEHKFEASFSEIENTGSTIRLWFDGFEDKYFFVTGWEVTCSINSRLNFTSEDITEVVTPVADDFTQRKTSDGAVSYWLYEPETGGAEPYPLVLVFHGYGDTNNIRAYRTSVAWAEPANQAVRPCYVFSPTIENTSYSDSSARDSIYESIHAEIKDLIDAGNVDPSRIYVMGNSFGGMATLEFLEKYPNFAAAGLCLCSAVNYSFSAVEQLSAITSIPLTLAAAEHDNTIPSSLTKNMYEKLTGLGDTSVRLRIYTDEEMNAAGADPDPNSTFSYHHVEMAVMEDVSYMEWMFSQTSAS